MAGAAALVVLIGGRVSGSRWTGLVAGLIMALTPVISFFAQTARSYALVFACVAGAAAAGAGPVTPLAVLSAREIVLRVTESGLAEERVEEEHPVAGPGVRDFRDVRDFAQAASPAQAGNFDGQDSRSRGSSA
jgi:hypothetical protein